MKALVTGHLNGLGKIGSGVLANHGYEVQGFDKLNDEDISDAAIRARIITASKECSIFFNNAYHESAQTKLVLEWAALNKNRRTHMVVSSSTVLALGNLAERWWEYRIAKLALEEAANLVNNSSYLCRVTVIRFGSCATELFIRNNPTFDLSQCLSTEALRELMTLAFTFKSNGKPLRLISTDV